MRWGARRYGLEEVEGWWWGKRYGGSGGGVVGIGGGGRGCRGIWEVEEGGMCGVGS